MCAPSFSRPVDLSPILLRPKMNPLPLLDSADVVVCGGGPGGVAAALCAARAGARVVLLERFGCLGGTWTSGILSAIMPFPYVGGVFREILARLDAAGGWRRFDHIEPNCTAADLGQDHAGGTYDSEILKVVLDELVTEAGVEVLFFVQSGAVHREGGRVVAVDVDSKEGRRRVEGRFFIDASGDGDLCALAGATFDQGRAADGATQPMTMIFKMDGVDDARALVEKRADHSLRERWQAAKAAGEITIPREDVIWTPMPTPGQWNFNTTRITGLDATKVRDITRAMILGRRQVAEVARFMRRRVPGFENARVCETPLHVGVRESRRIHADQTLTQDDIVAAREFPDAVARGNWFVDIHNPHGEGTVHVKAPAGRYYEIPYACLRPRGLDNVLVASRCLGSTHEAHAAVRITPQIVAIGQGAGTAAALAVAAGHADSRRVEPDALRAALRAAGAWV